ncbi:ABC transporter substrate-binding protein [soil metagenome]
MTDHVAELINKRLNRRTAIGGAAGAAIAMSSLSLGQNAAAQDVAGGTLVIDLGSEPENLDPHQGLAATTSMLTGQMFESFFRATPGTLDIEGALAETWEMSADGLSWTLNLRQGVKFHDGSDFNGEAVKFNFDRQFDETNEYYALGSWSGVGSFDFLESIEIVDPYTIIWHLSTPFNKFLYRMANFSIVSPAAVIEHREAFVDHPSGTGPYKFDRWDKGEQVVLVANPEYWSYTPSLGQVAFKAITEAGSRAAALLSGEVQLTVEISPETAEQLASDDAYEVSTGPTGALWFLAMNVDNAVFSDVRIRQAINYAIDKETIVSAILNDTADIAYGPLSSAFNDYNPVVEGMFSYDPEKAKALLEEAGYDGTEVAFRTSIGGSGMLSPEEMATFIQDNLREVGFNSKIEVIEFVSWMDAIRDPQNELTVMSWNIPPIEPDFMLNGVLSESSLPPGFNTSYWVDPEFEELIEIGRSSLDEAAVHEAYLRAQEIVMEQVPIVPVCHRRQVYGLSKRVTGFVPQPSMDFLLRDVTITE